MKKEKAAIPSFVSGRVLGDTTDSSFVDGLATKLRKKLGQ